MIEAGDVSSSFNSKDSVGKTEQNLILYEGYPTFSPKIVFVKEYLSWNNVLSSTYIFYTNS